MLENSSGPAPVMPSPRRDTVWTRLSLASAGIGFALFAYAYTPLNTDMGWTLALGKDLVETHQFLPLNTQSFTEPNHPVLTFQWAFNVLLYESHSAWGAAGLVIIKWILACLTVLGVYAALRHSTTWGGLQLLVLVSFVHVSWLAFELVRAQLVTFCILAFVVYAGTSGKRWALWACVPLTAVAVNFHGGYQAILVTLTGLCIGLGLEQKLGWSPRVVRTGEAVVICVSASLSTLLSPFGFRLVTETVKLSGDPARLLDREWLPLWRFAELNSVERIALVLLGLTLLAAAWLLRRRQLRFWFLLSLAVATSLMASRHLRMAPILLAPVVAMVLEQGALRLRLTSLLGRIEPRVAPLAALIGGACSILWASSLPGSLKLMDQPVPSPANAIAVMRLNGIKGNVWNDFDWGGILLWAAPDSKVACDGRHLAAYSGAMIAANIRLGIDARDPLAVAQGFGADLVLLHPRDPALPRLRKVYHPLYCDRDACLLSRRPADLALLEHGLRVPRVSLSSSDFFQSNSGPDAALEAADPGVMPGAHEAPKP